MLCFLRDLVTKSKRRALVFLLHIPSAAQMPVFFLTLCPPHMCLFSSFCIFLLRGSPLSHAFNDHPHTDDLIHIFPAQSSPPTSPSTEPRALLQYLLSTVLKGLSNSICPNPTHNLPSPSPCFLLKFLSVNGTISLVTTLGPKSHPGYVLLFKLQYPVHHYISLIKLHTSLR